MGSGIWTPRRREIPARFSRSRNSAPELVYPRRGALPAVGWSHEAERLKLDLQLPPGWTLLAAWGA
ncbi:MAG: hypothetical protein GY856_15860, partial [bacterium]|nr:hypothetical protein [bacterium]